MRSDRGSEVNRGERRVQRRNGCSTEQKPPIRPAEVFRGYVLKQSSGAVVRSVCRGRCLQSWPEEVRHNFNLLTTELKHSKKQIFKD